MLKKACPLTPHLTHLSFRRTIPLISGKIHLTFKDLFHVNPCVQRHEYQRSYYILQHLRPRHCTLQIRNT